MGNNIWAPSCQNELYHFGVKGMRWGVRKAARYSDGSYGRDGKRIQRARAIASKGGSQHYQKALNRLDTIAANVDADRQVSSYSGYRKMSRLLTKSDKAFDSGNMAKYDKITSKYEKTSKKYKEITGRQAATYEAAKKLSRDLIKEASSKGYTVSSAKTLGLTRRGQNLITSGILVGGIPGGLSSAASGAYSAGYRNRKLRNDASWNSDHYFELSGRKYSEAKGGNYNPYTYKKNQYSVKSSRRR